MQPTIRRRLYAAGALLLTLPLLLYSNAQGQRPAHTETEQALFAGITYRRQVLESPRPAVVHVAALDLTTPGVEVVVSPGVVGEAHEAIAQPTSVFLAENALQLAINASYFYPFQEKTPWNFYPHPGDPVQVLGQAIAAGREYAPPHPKRPALWPVLCFAANQQAQIVAAGQCPPGTMQAVAGNQELVVAGQLAHYHQTDRAYGRVAVAIDARGEKLWLIVVDGKQPRYSEGVTLYELAQIALALGADAALNLDGGGSATLAVATPAGAKVLNAPIHAKIPLRERPVANQLGFRATALPK